MSKSTCDSRQSDLFADVTVHRSPSFNMVAEISANQGEIVAILGPNGSGKSTLLSVLAGLLPLDSGEIYLNGRQLDSADNAQFVPAVDRHVGVVFQDLLLFPHLSVAENIAFGPRARGTSKDHARNKAVEFAEALGVGALSAVKANKLSGGQAQRVAIARALATEPELLLLDEPTSALDVETRSSVLATLQRNIQALDTVGVLVTHDPNEAYLLAQYLYVIEDGRVTQSGTPKDVYAQPATAYIEAASSKVVTL